MSECEPLPMAAIGREKTARRALCGMVGKTTHSLVTTFYTYLHPTPPRQASAASLWCSAFPVRWPGPLANPRNRLKGPADKLDRALHAGTVLRRGDQCPVRQIRQLG
jgi:hypothetical protein